MQSNNSKTSNTFIKKESHNVFLDIIIGKPFSIVDNNILKFVTENNEFYEGSYLNRVKFIPKSERWYNALPLWLICNGYIWEVRKQFESGKYLLELGCASGIDYFGERYTMIGLDLSFLSLKGIKNYKYKIQADASNLPLADESIDGIISSYFWEHIPSALKNNMLAEFRRVLKPDGKLVFLYDVETNNSLINKLKKKNLEFYYKEFIEKDGHLGYENINDNLKTFEINGFKVVKHFGMERTWFQSASVYEKLSRTSGISGNFFKLISWLLSNRYVNYINSLLVRIIDESIGRLFDPSKSRIVLTVAKKII